MNLIGVIKISMIVKLFQLKIDRLIINLYHLDYKITIIIYKIIKIYNMLRHNYLNIQHINHL
jgi:hypothetical protein